MESNIKPDRTDLDLLFGCLLEWGLPLSMPYRSEQVEGCTVHTYNDGDLIACFDKDVPESVVQRNRQAQAPAGGLPRQQLRRQPRQNQCVRDFQAVVRRYEGEGYLRGMII